MMCSTVPFVLVALSAAIAAPAGLYDDYPVAVPEKRAALVLDRLLIALQKALHDGPSKYERKPDGPQTAALRITDHDMVQKRFDLGTDWEVALEDLRNTPLRYARAPLMHHLSDDDIMGERVLAGGGEVPDEWLGPEDLRVAPLRPPVREFSDVMGLQRRGQSAGGAAGLRGRVLRCYFNAITCF